MAIISEREYLMNNYLHLVGGQSRLAFNQLVKTQKENYLKGYKKQFIDPQIKRGLYTEEDLNDFIKLTEEEAKDVLLKEIKVRKWDKFYLNRCPKCQNLGRTPYARQCPSCFFKWHDSLKGKFRVKKTYYLESRNRFYIMGEIHDGLVKIDWHVNLIDFNLNFKPKITAVDFMDFNNRTESYVCLGLEHKNEAELKLFEQMNILERIVEIEI
jgi:hypothetical protein